MSVCDDPSSFVNWDGIHYTKATYKLIFESIIEEPYSYPSFKAFCELNDNEMYFNSK